MRYDFLRPQDRTGVLEGGAVRLKTTPHRLAMRCFQGGINAFCLGLGFRAARGRLRFHR